MIDASILGLNLKNLGHFSDHNIGALLKHKIIRLDLVKADANEGIQKAHFGMVVVLHELEA